MFGIIWECSYLQLNHFTILGLFLMFLKASSEKPLLIQYTSEDPPLWLICLAGGNVDYSQPHLGSRKCLSIPFCWSITSFPELSSHIHAEQYLTRTSRASYADIWWCMSMLLHHLWTFALQVLGTLVSLTSVFPTSQASEHCWGFSYLYCLLETPGHELGQL